jgi:translation elongation factor EF-1alpha
VSTLSDMPDLLGCDGGIDCQRFIVLSRSAEPILQDDLVMQARIVVISVSRPIIPGQGAVLHMHAVSIPCRITKLLALLDKVTGAVQKSWPSLRTLGQDKAADVVLELDHPVCFDPWSECSVLHRLVLRIGDVVAAVGMGKVLEESP